MLNLANSTMFTSIVLTWNTPGEPNGIITRYEVTYTIGNGSLQTLNTTGLNTTFTISPLETGTRVSDVSVFAYTSVGRGMPYNLQDLRTLSKPCELLGSICMSLYHYLMHCICSYGDEHNGGGSD